VSKGFEDLCPIFKTNAIDGEVTMQLTEADLKKLGVVFGRCKKLMTAINQGKPAGDDGGGGQQKQHPVIDP
jgi:hypothetical protein